MQRIKKIMYTKTKLCNVILLGLLNFTAVECLGDNAEKNFQQVPPDRISRILTMISEKTRNNYDSIKTWHGKIDATTTIIYEGSKAERVFRDMTDGTGETPVKVKKQRDSTVEFVADCKNGSYYTNKFSRNPLKYMDYDSERVLGTVSNLGHNRSIVTAEFKIHAHESAKKGNSIIARTAIKEKMPPQRNCSTGGDDAFDPRSFLSDSPVWKTFPLMLQYIQKHGEFSIDGHSLRIEEYVDGTTTEYRIEIPGVVSPGQYLFVTIVFSSKNAFNPTLVETKRLDGKLFQKNTWDYEVIDGIYLPKRTTKLDFGLKNAALSYEKECTFINVKLNQSISDNTFSYRNLGLKDGDKFVDKILNKEYIYQDERLVPSRTIDKQR